MSTPNTPQIGFELRKIRLSLDVILPIRKIKSPEKTIARYKTILASIKEVGVIEPLMVFPQSKVPGHYQLLDGHLRYHALKKLGINEVDCIVSREDEMFTYNARISRLSPIQEHGMIMKAVKNGLTPERIAAALSLTVHRVKDAMNLLSGIHPETVEIIKTHQICQSAIRLLKKVKPLRQIEMAELMVAANIFSHSYVQAMVFATPKEQLVEPDKTDKPKGLSQEEVARMEHQMQSVEHDFKAVEQSYGENVLNLTLARGYVKKLLLNAKVVRFLSAKHSDIFSEFEAVAAMETL
jgi:ParB/RepB/Spo0J family partition protein